MSQVSRSASSFRDPGGFVFERRGDLLRQVNHAGRADYDLLMDSGLYETLAAEGLLVAHEVADAKPFDAETAFKVLRPVRVPFLSYPYEWCFSQLKDAALLTLDVQARAVMRGLSLKDASAYNVQFRGGVPVFIDTLSFEAYREGRPWVAYSQFCRHFLAPLALMSRVDVRLGQLLRANLDGIPLDLASRILPWKSRLSPGALIHLHWHARLQGSHSDLPAKPPQRGFGRSAMLGLIDNLRSTVSGLRWNPPKTEWSDYTADNSYSAAAVEQKRRLVAAYLDEIGPARVWDLGANTGDYSRLASDRGISTVAFDLDPACVERNYRAVRERGERDLLPLLVDLTNPSPSCGWDGHERQSLADRGPVDAAMALAVVHHLAIVHNLPLPHIADFFDRVAKSLIVEFVPKADPQVQRLLRGRVDIFNAYSREDFETSFSKRFVICRSEMLAESGRVVYLMRRKEEP